MEICRCPNCVIPEHWPQFTNAQWEILAPLLPQGTGRRADETRRQVNGMLYALEGSVAWHILPTQFHPWDTIETRFNRWAAQGVFRNAYHWLYPPRELADGRIVIVDGSYAKAHKSSSGARVGRTGRPCGLFCPQQCPRKPPWNCPETQAIGMTRGGRNTNIVIAVNEARYLVNWTLLPGNVAESKATPILLQGISPRMLVADEAHDKNLLRRLLDVRGIDAAIRNHPRRKKNPFPRRPEMRLQHVVDNYFSDLKGFRRIATRYEKTAEAYGAFIALAALYIALRRDYP